MNSLILRISALAVLVTSTIGTAEARSFTRSAQSGQTISIISYYTWNPDCTPAFGTVKLLNKPRHGKVGKRMVTKAIGPSRVVGVDGCYGKPIKALEVFYTSNPGFRGSDSFSFDVTFRRLREVDTFSVDVR